MKTTVAIFLSIIAVALLAIQFTPVEEEIPKPSHHVVFFYMCGSPEGILITTNPPTWVSGSYPPSLVQEALIDLAIENERTVSVFMIRPECLTQPKEKFKT